MKKNEEVT